MYLSFYKPIFILILHVQSLKKKANIVLGRKCESNIILTQNSADSSFLKFWQSSHSTIEIFYVWYH